MLLPMDSHRQSSNTCPSSNFTPTACVCVTICASPVTARSLGAPEEENILEHHMRCKTEEDLPLQSMEDARLLKDREMTVTISPL